MRMPLMAEYLQNTVPYAKQQEAFDAGLAHPHLFALFMQQRTGKTPVTLALLAHAYDQGWIDGALVVSMPSGVPGNWQAEILGDELEGRPARWLDRIPTQTLIWKASKAGTKRFQAEAEALLANKGFSFLLVNGEAILTDAFKKFAGRFLRQRKIFAVADETSLIMKSPNSKRTKTMEAIKKLCGYRLVLDGTPAEESPLDLYSQVGWLDKAFLGHQSYFSFKNHYAVWDKGFDPRSGREFPRLKGFQNLDELQRRLSSCSIQVRRKDCFDIAEKVYDPYRFDLSPTQRRVYDEIEEKHSAELADGTEVTVRMLLTRYLRYQQITSNYWPPDQTAEICPGCDGEGCDGCKGSGIKLTTGSMRIIDRERNPRLEALTDVVTRDPDPLIVWARFRPDVSAVFERLADLGRKPVRYDGAVSPEEKVVSKRLFQIGKAGAIVCNQAAAERGLDLSAARYHVYYSNTFSGLQRAQTEDRTEVAGRGQKGTGIIDLIAEGTVDEDIVAAHLQKRSLADLVMGRLG